MRSQGIALVVTLALLVLIALLAFSTFFRTQIELWVTRNDTTSVQAFYAAEAGLQKYKAALFQQIAWREQVGHPEEAGGGSPACYSSTIAGFDWERNGNYSYFRGGIMELAVAEPVYDAQGNPIGSYTVQLREIVQPGGNRRYLLVSQGTSSGARAAVQAVLELDTSAYLDYAIFAGTGQANRWLNGGATIRGGIYITGDPNRPNDFVIESNGNFSLLNHYNLNTGYGSARDYVDPQYRQVNDLCASLRVQHGRIAVGGSTLIGEPDNPVKGVFVGRGGNDITGVVTDVCQNNRGVCAEATGPFDLANPPPFPELRATGSSWERIKPPACQRPGTSYSNWASCLVGEAQRRGVHIQFASNGQHVISWPSLADLPLDSVIVPPDPTACRAALNQSRSGHTLTLGGKAVDCSYTITYPTGQVVRGGFRYLPGTGNAPNLLEVFDHVTLEGFDLVLNQQPRGNNEDTTLYRARTYTLVEGERQVTRTATLAVLRQGTQGGNLDLNGRLYPSLAALADDPEGQTTFPHHALGLVAEGNVYQRASQVMAPLYAGGIFRIVKQNVLFGSVITREFCTTSAGNQDGCAAGQSAEVVYIRIPRDNRPLAMPAPRGGKPVFRVLSYERR
ncbi:PilX N-terminal domain-containing pilus assembly protein [Thermus thermamylovorans]|uniref:Competence protein ComZ n=1 Tax=Thermus thermamylovorans TaxID=2509362 RepID=A0A4Q9AZU7_9DEIN|nr:PilX N-terminal domain-containing pilus assembly protein [Thermus thermamylovorans]TBH17405.1 competence protein ComZ [Thermus thermamylovorans]